MKKRIYHSLGSRNNPKNYWSIAFAILLFLSTSYGLSAQDPQINGMVTDEAGTPLPGVSIFIKDSSVGTQSDFDGNYTIKGKKGQIIVFSYLGMTTIERTIGDLNIINVVMAESSQSLDEVVVVAYGTKTKKAIVGSVEAVGPEVLEKQQVTSVASALQGTAAGVNILNTSGGQPGSNPTIRIRGFTSINGNNSPLIVVDGAVYVGNINAFSPDQIESISVLKDASATALYGSRATAGVLIITTKKGQINTAPKVSIRSQLGFSSPAVKYHEIMGIDDQFISTWEALRNDNLYAVDTPLTVEEAATAATNGLVGFYGYNPYGPENPDPVDVNGNLVSNDKLWETDWRELLLNDSALRNEHSFSVAGGSESTTYNLSANYLRQEGTVQTSKFERITTLLNIDSQATDWLKAGLGLTYSNSTQNLPDIDNNTNGATNWAFRLSPIYPIYERDANGELVRDNLGDLKFDFGVSDPTSVNGDRPFARNQHAYANLFFDEQEQLRDNITLNGYLKANLTRDLSIQTRIAHSYLLYDYFYYSSNEFGSSVSVGGQVDQTKDSYITTTLTNSLNYNKSFGFHNVDLTFLQEAYNYKFRGLNAQGQGLLTGSKNLGATTTPTNVGGGEILHRISSLLGRASYNFKEKYFLEGSIRTDKSSRFSPETREGTFYSIGGSWIVSEERFLNGNNTLNYLKLKASYGELGNEGFGDDFFLYQTPFLSGYDEGTNTGVLLAWPNDPRITWEKTRTTNIGIDFRLFNLLDATAEYFNKETYDLFYNVPTPISTGAGSFTTNNGSMRNYGWEFSLNSQNVSSDKFEWRTNFNITNVKNEVTELVNEVTSGTKRLEEGRSLFEFYMREYAGVNPDTGEAQWFMDILDENGEPTGERDITTDYNLATQNFTGKESIPKFTGGLTNYFRFGNFDLNILVYFSFGGHIYDYDYAALMHGFRLRGTAASVDLKNRWKQPGDVTDIPRLQTRSNSFNFFSDRFLFKNDFVRLRALTLGYNLPSDILNKIGLSKLRLFFQGDNMLTYQSHKGIDPEQNFAGTASLRPQGQKIYAFGLMLNF